MVFGIGEKMNLIDKYNYDKDIKLRNFEKYVRRQDLARFLARYELFKMIKDVKGSIIECGIHYGGGGLWLGLNYVLILIFLDLIEK